MCLYGGAELVIGKLANYLTKKGIDNAILTLILSSEIRNNLDGSSIILPKEKLASPRNFITTALMLRKYFSKVYKTFDVINVHNFPAELLAFGCAKPFIWMCNEPLTLYFGDSLVESIARTMVMKIDRYVVNRYVKAVVVADEFNAKRFEKLYGIKPVINYYGIDYEFFSKGNANRARKMFNLNKDDFILLQVGMITPLKNQMESVKTLEKLKNKIEDVKLILAGQGNNEYERMIRRYVQHHKLEENVIFTGHLQREIIRDLYKACNVALYPIKSQGGWLSPFEALCAGAPIVVSRMITSADIIRKNNLGIVTNNFVNAILDIYKNQKYYRYLAKKAGLWVKKNLSWEKFCERMVELFNSLTL